MLQVRFIFFLIAVCIFSCQRVQLEAKANDALKKTKFHNDFFFFPYNSCILATIDELLLAKGTNCSIDDKYLARVTINRVLRGDFKPGEKVTFILPRNDADYLLNSKSRNEFVGRKCLLAFNFFAFNGERRSSLKITNLYCPLRGSQITAAAVESLQQKLKKMPFQRRSCLAVTILKVEKKRFGYKSMNARPPVFVASVRVDDILLGHRSYKSIATIQYNQIPQWEMKPFESFKAGELLQCSLGNMPPDNIFPKRPQSEWTGSKCIWSFNPKENTLAANEPILDLDDISTPFPYQIYTASELENLKAELALNSERLNGLVEEVQQYVKTSCSINQLKEFCQPENRCSGTFRSFPSTSNNRVLYAKLFSSEKQNSEVKSEFGTATWFVDIVDGVPRAYEVLVDRGGPNRWLFHSPISLRPIAGEIFIRERLFQTLQYGILNYLSRHNDDGLVSGLEKIQLIPPGTLIRDSRQRISEFKCCLANGQTLKANLDKDLKICDVSISGRPSEIVKKAIKTTVENWDWCWRQREGL